MTWGFYNRLALIWVSKGQWWVVNQLLIVLKTILLSLFCSPECHLSGSCMVFGVSTLPARNIAWEEDAAISSSVGFGQPEGENFIGGGGCGLYISPCQSHYWQELGFFFLQDESPWKGPGFPKWFSYHLQHYWYNPVCLILLTLLVSFYLFRLTYINVHKQNHFCKNYSYVALEIEIKTKK